jgi:hypothetical protein
MAASKYRIVLRGWLSENFESAFDGMTVEHAPNRTVLTGDVRDQAQLYGLIGRLQEFGIELLAVEPADVSDGSCEPGAGPVVSGLHVRRRSGTHPRQPSPATGDPPEQAADDTEPDCVFRRDGEVWTLRYGGRQVRLRDSKGLRDLHALLTQPGTAVAALDLAGGAPGRVPAATDAGEVIDAQARSAYRQRLRELEEEAAEADAAADIGHSARITAERDALVEALTQAYGLGGRVRRSGSDAERARTAVTARLKDAIRRIGEAHPDLGRHLARSVRTGTFCVYEPDQPTVWFV